MEPGVGVRRRCAGVERSPLRVAWGLPGASRATTGAWRQSRTLLHPAFVSQALEVFMAPGSASSSVRWDRRGSTCLRGHGKTP